MKYDLTQISLIIATYNEEESIDYVLRELEDYNFFEIIIVDKNSIDRTLQIANSYNVKIINQLNKGWGSAVIQGFKYASGNYLTYMDADGSYNPKTIIEMFEKTKEYDFVCASRYKDNNISEDDTLIRSIGNKFFTFITNHFLNLKISDSLFFYPLIKKEDFEKINPKSLTFGLCVEIPYLLSLVNLTYVDILSLERKRYAGKSKVNAFTDGVKILIDIVKMYLRS